MKYALVFRLGWAVAVAWIGGCASRGVTSGRPLHRFPSQVEIAQLVARQGNTTARFDASFATFEAWRMDLQATHDPAVRRITERAVPSATNTPALECVAHELGRVLLESGDKQPDLSLRRFVAARCGAVISTPSYQSWHNDVPASVGDAQVADALVAQLDRPVDSRATQAGTAIVRAGTRVMIVVVFGTPEVAMEPFEQVVDASGTLILRGQVAFETEMLLTYINRGESGVTPCDHDPAIAPPAFAVKCRIADGESFAWVEMFALPKGRVLGRSVIDLIALRDPTAAATYTRRRVESGRPSTDATFGVAAVELLNAVRQQAGLRPVMLAQRQSATVDALTPALAAAFLGSGAPSAEAAESADAISISMLAGWQVDGGTIRSGSLALSVVSGARDAERWLLDAVERPQGRVLLLDGDVRQLALGVVDNVDASGFAVVAAGYSFFDTEPPGDARAQQLLERLASVRAARGLGETVMVEGIPNAERRLEQIRTLQASPAEALQLMLNDVSQVMGRAVGGYVWEATDLDAIEFPPALLRPGRLAIGAAVTHYRAQGGAWGQYSVLFVIVEAPQGLEV